MFPLRDPKAFVLWNVPYAGADENDPPHRATAATANISGFFDSLPSQCLFRHQQTRPSFPCKLPSACRLLQRRISI